MRDEELLCVGRENNCKKKGRTGCLTNGEGDAIKDAAGLRYVRRKLPNRIRSHLLVKRRGSCKLSVARKEYGKDEKSVLMGRYVVDPDDQSRYRTRGEGKRYGEKKPRRVTALWAAVVLSKNPELIEAV